MSFAFDLISDLHIDTWPDEFDWAGRATSPVCVVAGDIGRDRARVMNCLEHLGRCYHAVLYIDGNDEHVSYFDDLAQSYSDLSRQIAQIAKVVFLHGNVVVVDGVAFLGTNGWWGFDFDTGVDQHLAQQWYINKWNGTVSQSCVDSIINIADTDCAYLATSLQRLQSHADVDHIVIVTHTVPLPTLIQHDIELQGSELFNVMGNRSMSKVLNFDKYNKIHTWCFGHYHLGVDQVRSGIRYVSNCRGRGSTAYSQYAYHARRVVIDH